MPIFRVHLEAQDGSGHFRRTTLEAEDAAQARALCERAELKKVLYELPQELQLELCARYASGSGLPVDEIDYYVVLARFKIAIVLEGGYARYVKGGADNPKMAAFGDVVLDMARKAAELARTTRLGR